MPEVDYRIEELMACRIADQVDASGVTVLGSFTPLAYASYMLAKLTTAPDAFVIGFNGLDIPAVELNVSSVEAEIYRHAAGRWSFLQTTNTVHMGGRGLVECISPAQVDGDGAFNVSAIGDYERPKVRLPGGAGAPEVMQHYRKVILYLGSHDRRRLVERVDFRSGQRRRRAGARDDEGPIVLVTPLAILVKYNDEAHFRLHSLHPGASSEEVVDNCGFRIEVPTELATTTPPNGEELRLLRERIDPFGTIRFDFMPAAERRGYVERIVAAEWKRAREAIAAGV